MARMEHRLQITFKRYALLMEDKMAAKAFRRANNYGEGGYFKRSYLTEALFAFGSFRTIFLLR